MNEEKDERVERKKSRICRATTRPGAGDRVAAAARRKGQPAEQQRQHRADGRPGRPRAGGRVADMARR